MINKDKIKIFIKKIKISKFSKYQNSLENNIFHQSKEKSASEIFCIFIGKFQKNQSIEKW